ncbi:MAG: hydrogenase nickel incorporation protein HypB [Firmicutes bacterium]|nr:hydrogenase nickel incorporation protein HypB [Bacillota bacterium]
MEIPVKKSILEDNETIAARLKEKWEKTLVLNLMSSPGAGKTTLLEKTAEKLNGKLKMAVIEGDLATRIDAERIEKHGIPVIQINTGKGCHLNAKMVEEASLNLPAGIDILFIENVGNLVCPAEFSLGEDLRVILVSVPEGDEKPLKYPVIFRSASAFVINKVDLAPYVNFSIEKAKDNALGINSAMELFEVSCYTDAGLDEWISWLVEKRKEKK